MRGPLRWEEHPEKVDWAESSLELSVSEAKGSELGTGHGIGLGEAPGLDTDLGTELGDSLGLCTELGTELGEASGLGTELGTGLGDSPGLGTGLDETPGLGIDLCIDLGESKLLGDRERGNRYRRLHCLCLVTGLVGRSRNRRSRACFR